MTNHYSQRSFIGGSDARIIMGDDEALLRLWREKRREIEPEDLSGNLIVQLGVVTEALNRHWHEANSGQAMTARSDHWRRTVRRRQILSLSPLPLSQPDPGTTTVLFDELDASSLQHFLYCSECCQVAGIPPGFDVRDCIAVETGCLCQIPNRPI